MGRGDIRPFSDFIGQVAGTFPSLSGTVLDKQEFPNCCYLLSQDKCWKEMEIAQLTRKWGPF